MIESAYFDFLFIWLISVLNFFDPRIIKLKTLLRKRLWHRYFPVNFVKFLRAPFLQNTSGRLLLDLVEFSFYPLNSFFETLENLNEGWWYSRKFHSLKHDWNYSHIKTVTSHRYKVAITCWWLIFCALLSAIRVKICSVYHDSDIKSYRMHWLNSDLKLQRIFVFW